MEDVTVRGRMPRPKTRLEQRGEHSTVPNRPDEAGRRGRGQRGALSDWWPRAPTLLSPTAGVCGATVLNAQLGGLVGIGLETLP